MQGFDKRIKIWNNKSKNIKTKIEMARDVIELNCEAEHAGINVSRVLQEALMKVLNLEHRR